MDLKYIAMGLFLTTWATLGGLLSGVVMGLFFIVYQDGVRKGVLPPQSDGATKPERSGFYPAFATLTSRQDGGYR